MIALRDFTKSDWYGWAGAERPSEEVLPRIGFVRPVEWPVWDVEESEFRREEFEVTVIVDRNGVSLSGWNREFYLECKDFRIACFVAEHLVIDKATIDRLGFKGCKEEAWLRLE